MIINNNIGKYKVKFIKNDYKIIIKKKLSNELNKVVIIDIRRKLMYNIKCKKIK